MKVHYYINIAKNPEQGGAWLATAVGKDREGNIVSNTASAWTTLAKAKKWGANQVGRNRLSWVVVSATPDNKPTAVKFDIEIKKDA